MHLILWLTCGLILFITSTPQAASSDESPGFFLKITKNVPRLGRRSDKPAENYFFKNMKTIPRIGRSGRNPFEMSELIAWFAGDQQSLPQLSKRRLANPEAERELSMVQPVNANTLIELLDKDAIPSENVKFVHWKDFDRALQFDGELYGKVISLGRKPDYSLKKDLNVGGYVPLFGNPNDGGADFMFYNRGDQDRYMGKYDDEFLHYNHLK